VRWLRQALPRGSRVNLRPLGQQDGQLLARVVQPAPRPRPGVDLGPGWWKPGWLQGPARSSLPRPLMSLNRTAKGIVLVPSLLLGAAFLAAGVWSDGPSRRQPRPGPQPGAGC
jgi:hypothetical protein